MADQLTTIGKSEIRKDAWQKAAGKALYTADITVENLYYGVVVRSPHHYARILEINKTAALKIPGVHQILTAEDIPGEKIFGPLVPDQPSLAQGVVRHLGEPVALVIAETRLAAQKAKEEIKIIYQPLVPVFDPVLAVKSDAPQLHKGGNLVTELNVQDGDIKRGY